jgi:chemotaxis methyl-accepting protein methylase
MHDLRPLPSFDSIVLRNALSYFDRALTDLALPIQKVGRAMHEKTPEPSR